MTENPPRNWGVPTMIPISDGDNPSDFMCKEIKFHSDAMPERRKSICPIKFIMLRWFFIWHFVFACLGISAQRITIMTPSFFFLLEAVKCLLWSVLQFFAKTIQSFSFVVHQDDTLLSLFKEKKAKHEYTYQQKGWSKPLWLGDMFCWLSMMMVMNFVHYSPFKWWSIFSLYIGRLLVQYWSPATVSICEKKNV